ncbi:hypothetical protein L249_6874 [Ophiocordyceps polyrhachis-furcata BCC 54312]|uniref:Uncharacterized protein n=1 Tax=Ophiocordyceps polyrhachis-furcata BCC 54312 TaxID=1330021 RepID=A0A367LJG8_9HYPO|nr:hypothetical protein L249_6874 [Ophiocordyceps polyrhachis-furcata BCC 54312]
MAGVKSALPSHLRPAGDGSDDNGFERRHHGKTRSHMATKKNKTFDLGLLDTRTSGPPFSRLPFVVRSLAVPELFSAVRSRM